MSTDYQRKRRTVKRPTNAVPKSGRIVMAARRPSSCPACSDPIDAGELITSARPIGWVHARAHCLAAVTPKQHAEAALKRLANRLAHYPDASKGAMPTE